MMFDLEAAMRDWRRTARAHAMSPSDLDELEDHLRSACAAQIEYGRLPGEAFATALRSLGPVAAVSAEYRKVRSSTWTRLLRTAWAGFALAFFLPVVDGGITLLEGNLREGLLPGFQAILVASEEPGWSTWSVLTNLLMLGTLWRVRDLGRVPVALLAVVLSGAAVLNGWWLTAFDPLVDLRAGYYVWWGSFGLASSALAMRAKELWTGVRRIASA